MELAVVETAAAEALLFSRSVAIVGSLWAWWLAAMAAAVGFWRFRSVAVSKPAAVAVTTIAADAALHPPTKMDAATGTTLSAPSAKPDSAATVARKEALALPLAQLAAGRSHLEDCFGTPKGRFTAYFHAEAGEEEAAGQDDEEEDDAADEKALGEGIGWQEVVAAAATEVRCGSTGDLGWYRYQDRSALNGRVVRLWDGDWRLTAAPAIGRKRAPFKGKLGMSF